MERRALDRIKALAGENYIVHSNQIELFPISRLPEGFVYQSNFVAAEEEAQLVSTIQSLHFEAVDFHGFKSRRRVAQYGWEYSFESRKATAGKPLPDFLQSLRERAANFAGVPADTVAEAIVAEYPQGAPIGWHRDVPYFEVVMGISLISSCKMRLKPSQPEGKITSIVLEPRSIYVLSGQARWRYLHSIPPVKSLRYSITLRTLSARALNGDDLYR